MLFCGIVALQSFSYQENPDTKRLVRLAFDCYSKRDSDVRVVFLLKEELPPVTPGPWTVVAKRGFICLTSPPRTSRGAAENLGLRP